jgi:colicin import membrane protein
MFGIGAKTNVGYGQFEVVLTQEEIEERKKEEDARIQAEKEAKEKADQEAKEKAESERLAKEEALKKEKEQKKSEGLSALLDCKTLADGFKLLGNSFGQKPKPTEEEKKIIIEFKNKHKNLSKKDNKVFKKYGI